MVLVRLGTVQVWSWSGQGLFKCGLDQVRDCSTVVLLRLETVQVWS